VLLGVVVVVSGLLLAACVTGALLVALYVVLRAV
jgi:hypothetical protein